MKYNNTLLDCTTVNEHLGDPGWVLVDCRFNLMDTEAGRRAYLENHIPGARYAHLDDDLSGRVTSTSGRHPLPEPGRFAQTLGRWGIDNAIQVVAYDGGNGSQAVRLWWMMRWLGSERCAVLDGGLAVWRASGFPLNAEVPEPRARVFEERHDDALWVDTDAVLANVRTVQGLLIDARSGVRFRGEQEPIDPVAGHVPGAFSLPLEGNLKEDGRFLEASALRERFAGILGKHSPEQVIHMCGSGVTACHNLLAMEIAGLGGSRLYPGSWSEWIRDHWRPVARGAD